VELVKKSITMLLIDGEPSGRIKCTLGNWTGVAYKIPRIMLESSKNREHLKQSGVYFLLGKSDDTNKGIAYIGQAGARKNGEGLLYRLLEHKRNPEKDFWNEVIVLTTLDNSLGPTEISYLESCFCKMAIKADRYLVKNGNEPTLGNISEEKECVMQEFIERSKDIIGILGHNLFEPIDPLTEEEQENTQAVTTSTSLYLKRTIKNIGEVEATGLLTTKGFVVLKGSRISLVDDDTISPALKERRKKAHIDSNGILIDSELFNSPSYAAMFVIGKSANGLTSWKTEEGRSLKQLEDAEE